MPILEQWRIEPEKKETEIFKLRHKSFLEPNALGLINFSKPLIDLIQQERIWTEEDLLKELHIDSKDGDAIRIVGRQLEELSKFGLVSREPDGWKWADRVLAKQDKRQ